MSPGSPSSSQSKDGTERSNNEEPKQPRQKRLKVNRACYTCRVKKIKCDGLQPCMQCRARQRPCSFAKDGTLDPDGMDEEQQMAVPESQDLAKDVSNDNNKPRKEPKANGAIQAEEREKQRKTIDTLRALSATWPAEGREGRWGIDETMLYAQESWQRTLNYPQPGRFRGLNEVVVQQHLIALFFRRCYAMFPVIPKRTLYDHLERRGPLCTPLLLYSIYAIAARFCDDNGSSADNYFNRAVSMLDDYLDVPRVSTIAALCLLSLYEPSTKSAEASRVTPTKSQTYCTLAVQMCLQLGLHKRYLASEQLTSRESELCKRVFWSCYCLDKMHSICAGRPWTLRSSDIDLDMPLLQPGDDVEEHEILEYFVAFIKLLRIGERAVQPDMVWAVRAVVRTYEQEQMASNYENELLLWLRSLPSHLQWTPFPTNPNSVPRQPPRNASVAHLHLFYNFVELAVIRPYSAGNGKALHQRCSTVATNLAQLACSLAEQTSFILSYTFVAKAIMAAVRVHVLNCPDQNHAFARHSRIMFQRSLRSLETLYGHRSIHGVDHFVSSLKKALDAADENNVALVIQDLANGAGGGDPVVPAKSESLSRQTYFSCGLITPPTIGHAMKGNLLNRQTYSSFMRQQQQEQGDTNRGGTFHSGDEQTTTDIIFNQGAVDWRTQDINNNNEPQNQRYPFDILAMSDPWTKSDNESMEALLYKGRSIFSNDNHIGNDNEAASQIDALVAQMQDSQRTGVQQDQGTNNSSWNAMNPNNNMSTQGQDLLYSMWPQSSDVQSSSQEHPSDRQQQRQQNQQQQRQQQRRQQPQQQPQQQQQQAPPPLSQPQSMPFQTSYMNIGLGVYASAHQHHTDVIRQHFPAVAARVNPSVRPVILTHHGHVIVAGPGPEQSDTGTRS